MTAQHKKRGLPRELEEELACELPEQSPEEFAAEFFGEADKPQDTLGMPPLSWIKENYKTKSAAIRYLINQGFLVKDIAKHLGIKYQMVRNVATNKLKRGPNEDWRPKQDRGGGPVVNQPPLLHPPVKKEGEPDES